MRRQFYIVLVLWMVLTVNEITCDIALTDAEIQELLNNNFNVTIDDMTGTITLEHVGYPDHDFVGGWGNNPNEALFVNHSYTLPREATVAATKGCAGGLGPIGFAVSGAVFYNPYTAFGWDAVEGQCAEDLDDCWGHPSPDGTYHYHKLPECLYHTGGDLRDKFLGVALDGYPIYGPMNSTYQNITTADLDECHGHYYNGRYMYRATFDFPYILSCYHGEDVKETATGQGPPQGLGPPPARKRRHADDHNIHRRQTKDDACMSAEIPNWNSLTCIVSCKNAGKYLDDCSSSDSVVSTAPSLALIVLMHSFVVRIM